MGKLKYHKSHQHVAPQQRSRFPVCTPSRLMVRSNLDVRQHKTNVKVATPPCASTVASLTRLPGSALTGEPFARRVTLPKKRLAGSCCFCLSPAGRMCTIREQTWGQFCTRTTRFSVPPLRWGQISCNNAEIHKQLFAPTSLMATASQLVVAVCCCTPVYVALFSCI